MKTMTTKQVMQRHWPKVLAGLLAIGLAAVVAREIPPAIRYIKMERMLTG
jgi:hypothetical protein